MPAIAVADGAVLVAYIVAEPKGGGFAEEYAVVRFDGVLQHTFGYPNDEALGGHPLYKVGLKFYAFNEICDSPYVAELGHRNAKTFPGSESHYLEFRHWVVTFHDETLEVVGTSVTFLGASEAESAQHALLTHAA